MKKFFFATLCSMFLPLSSCAKETPFNNSPVQELDLKRYLGQWYEIARYDHFFERGLTNTTANYSLLEDGKIQVVNSGYKNDAYQESIGKAKTTDTIGLLRVSFFGPFYSDYRVLYVDENYSYALVGSKSKNYLWILSRTPALPTGAEEILMNEINYRGYDPYELIWVDQSYNYYIE